MPLTRGVEGRAGHPASRRQAIKQALHARASGKRLTCRRQQADPVGLCQLQRLALQQAQHHGKGLRSRAGTGKCDGDASLVVNSRGSNPLPLGHQDSACSTWEIACASKNMTLFAVLAL